MPTISYNPEGYNLAPKSNVVTGNLISNFELEKDIENNRNINIDEL